MCRPGACRNRPGRDVTLKCAKAHEKRQAGARIRHVETAGAVLLRDAATQSITQPDKNGYPRWLSNGTFFKCVAMPTVLAVERAQAEHDTGH